MPVVWFSKKHKKKTKNNTHEEQKNSFTLVTMGKD